MVLNRRRTVVMRVGDQIAKITVSGRRARNPDQLRALATAMAALLARQSAQDPSPNPKFGGGA